MDALVVTCGVIYNFSALHPNSMINCLPVVIDLIIKLVNSLKIPLESYFLLFQVIRDVYPRVSFTPNERRLQTLIAPLRTILSTDLPMLKYYNYPVLEELTPLQRGQIPVGHTRQQRILEDETNMGTYFPLQFLRQLPEELSSNSYEVYPGQMMFQKEARTIIQLLTPINSNKLMKGIKKLKIVDTSNNVHYREKNKEILNSVGRQIIASKVTMMETVMNNDVDEIYMKMMIDEFDRNHKL